MKHAAKIKITKNGPYQVSGGLPLYDETPVIGMSGDPEEWRLIEEYPARENYALCRCGKSGKMPYCDGTHVRINFDGTETASRKTFTELSETITGPELDLSDAQQLCSSARFCHLAKGTWYNVKRSNHPDSKKLAIRTACNCPSGRLVVMDKKTGRPIEPEYGPSISVTYDPQAKVGGPLWVKGYVQVESADGFDYEPRNRVTLCSCGGSRNKPYCDGSHF